MCCFYLLDFLLVFWGFHILYDNLMCSNSFSLWLILFITFARTHMSKRVSECVCISGSGGFRITFTSVGALKIVLFSRSLSLPGIVNMCKTFKCDFLL
jgi:hypothetical protein